jgi:hypothetical protein
MEEHSIKMKPTAVPVWLMMRPVQIPPFIITPTCRKKIDPLPYSIQKRKAESMNPEVIGTFQHDDVKEILHGQ